MADILFLTELLPYPLNSGAKIRIYYVLKQLSQRHHVTLLSFTRPDDRPEDVAHLQSFLHDVQTVPMQRSWPRNIRAAAVSLFTGRPAIVEREEIAAMRRNIQDLLSNNHFDIVHADQIPMARYGLIAPRHPARRLLDQHNATFQLIERMASEETNPARRLFLRREARAFARYEPDVCRCYNHVTFVTEEDRQALLARMPGASLLDWSTVIPICVDTAAVDPVPPVADPFRVTHIGTMYWPPNVDGLLWFAAEVWPDVVARVRDARLTLVGKNPSAAIRALGDRPDIDVVGYVPDLTPYLAETAAFVVPLHAAGGMRVKIVDAWCWGVPVVSTPIGAEGIRIRDGENIRITLAAPDFARAVVQLLTDPASARRLRAAGRAWVEQHYDWRRVYPAWDEVYDRLLEK